MSLPSVAIHYDINGNELHREFVNIGWFVSEDAWIRCIHEQVYYVQGSVIVDLYGIKFPLKWKHTKYEGILRQLFKERQAAYVAKQNLDGHRDYFALRNQGHRNSLCPEISIEKIEQQKMLLPLIRKVIPSVIATELVGVQPMSEPAGLVFSMREKYFRETWYKRVLKYIKKVFTEGDDYYLFRALSQIKRLREREENFKSPEQLKKEHTERGERTNNLSVFQTSEWIDEWSKIRLDLSDRLPKTLKDLLEE